MLTQRYISCAGAASGAVRAGVADTAKRSRQPASEDWRTGRRTMVEGSGGRALEVIDRVDQAIDLGGRVEHMARNTQGIEVLLGNRPAAQPVVAKEPGEQRVVTYPPRADVGNEAGKAPRP